MVDLFQLAVTQGLLVDGRCRHGVELDLDVEDGLVVAFRRAERCQDQRCLEGLGRGQELDGELGLLLLAGRVSDLFFHLYSN